MAAPVSQNTNAVANITAATSATIAADPAVVAGDVIEVVLSIDAGAGNALVWPTDFVEIADVVISGQVRLAAAYKIATASEPADYTVTYGVSETNCIGIRRITGVDTSDPIGRVSGAAVDGSSYSDPIFGDIDQRADTLFTYLGTTGSSSASGFTTGSAGAIATDQDVAAGSSVDLVMGSRANPSSTASTGFEGVNGSNDEVIGLRIEYKAAGVADITDPYVRRHLVNLWPSGTPAPRLSESFVPNALVMLLMGIDAPSGASDIWTVSGWTKLSDLRSSDAATGHAVYYRKNTSPTNEAVSMTVSDTGEQQVVHLVEWGNVDADSPIGASSTSESAASEDPSWNSITTQQDASIAVAFGNSDVATNLRPAPTNSYQNYHQLTDGFNSTTFFLKQIPTAGATGGVTVNLANGEYSAVHFELKKAAAGVAIDAAMTLPISLGIATVDLVQFEGAASLGVVGGLSVSDDVSFEAVTSLPASVGVLAAATSILGATMTLGKAAAMLTAGGRAVEGATSIGVSAGLVSAAEAAFFADAGLGLTASHAGDAGSELLAMVNLPAALAVANAEETSFEASMSLVVFSAAATSALASLEAATDLAAAAGMSSLIGADIEVGVSLASSLAAAADGVTGIPVSFDLGLTGGFSVAGESSLEATAFLGSTLDLSGSVVASLLATAGFVEQFAASVAADGDLEAAISVGGSFALTPAAAASLQSLLSLGHSQAVSIDGTADLTAALAAELRTGIASEVGLVLDGFVDLPASLLTTVSAPVARAAAVGLALDAGVTTVRQAIFEAGLDVGAIQAAVGVAGEVIIELETPAGRLLKVNVSARSLDVRSGGRTINVGSATRKRTIT